ncbi:MAG: Smr/MutS family protein [Spirochaetales bacterium]|nr:Smr/MutS family protein [Candidatus Physcosoma equi]
MSKKAKGPDLKRVLIDEGKSVSPFANIVLKEKKEPEKPKKVEKPVPKKPNEIVQGYIPSASFADILESFETTGNPYRMPERKASAPKPKASFGDILDQWEGKTPKKSTKKTTQPEAPKATYKATKSFADILNQYEGQVASRAQKEDRKPQQEKKPEVVFRGTTLFIEGDEDDEVAPNAVWSVLGGKNNSYVRPEEPKKEKKDEKKEYVRSTPKYQPQKSFAEILGTYDDDGKKKRQEEEQRTKELLERQRKESRKKRPDVMDEKVAEPTFFLQEDEETKVPTNVSWSIVGGRNENYVKPVEKKPEPKEESKKEKDPVPAAPKKTEYKPQKSFDAILMDYEKEVVKKNAYRPQPAPEKKEEVKPEEPNFFLKEDEENKVPVHVAWSIIGGRNSSYVRPVEEKEEETKEEKPLYERASAPYVPEKKFSTILKDYAKDKDRKRRSGNLEAKEKTFEEIMKEKGDKDKQKPRYSINDLRRMDPQATLDLHGETQAESEAQIRTFLEEAKTNGLRKISIITGKGLHSEDGQGVLKGLAEKVLEESGMVSEKSFAPLNKGGSGALWIILKELKNEV